MVTMTLAETIDMNTRCLTVLFGLMLVGFASSCNHSRLNPARPVGSVTVVGMFDGSDEVLVAQAMQPRLLSALSKAKPVHHTGSPHPRLKYRLTVKQSDLVEHFYFLDDGELISCELAPPERSTVVIIMKDIIEERTANN